ncbi:hypothetical protein PSHT_05584, partial [Puccinia striiformis]
PEGHGRTRDATFMEDHTGPSGNPSTEASASLIEETCVSPRPMIPHRRPTSARPAEVQPARCNVGAVTPNCHTLIQALSWAMDDKTRQVIVPQHRLGLYELCVAGPMQHQAGRMHDTAATARRHMMTRPAAPNTSPSDDGEVACAGVWSTGNEDVCDQDRDDLNHLEGCINFVIPETPPRGLDCRDKYVLLEKMWRFGYTELLLSQRGVLFEGYKNAPSPSARALRSSSPMWLSLPRGSDELGNTGFSASPPEPSISETLSERQSINPPIFGGHLCLQITLLQELIVVASGSFVPSATYSDCWRILGLSIFAIIVPENITCTIIIDTEQAIHDIAQHIGTEPSTGTVAEGITGGEVGRTFEDHTNPIDDKWVTAQKAKGEQHVDLQQLIAKIPQLRDISTIQARNEGLNIYKIPTFSRIPQRLKVIHDQIFWSMKNDLLNLKGMRLGFCISLQGATVAEAKISENPSKKNPNLRQRKKLSDHPEDILCIIHSSNFQRKLTKQKHNTSVEHPQGLSGPVDFETVTNESNPDPQDSSRSDMESKKLQNIVKNISEKSTYVSARTETEAQNIPHLMMDCSTSQEVMKSWNRGIVKDLKDIYAKLLYRDEEGYRHRHETYKRLILQTVDFLYKHEMIDVVLDQKQKTKFEYAAHQHLFHLRAWSHVGTRGWMTRAHAWRKTLFGRNKTVKNNITLHKYLERHSDNDPQEAHEVQICLIEMIRHLDYDESLSYNAWKARRIEWRSISQLLGFIQENYQEVFLQISHEDIQLEDKLELLRSSSQFLGKLENIRIYLNEYIPSRGIWVSDLKLQQPRKSSMTCLEELNLIYEYVELINKEHNQKHSDIKTGNPLEYYLQREDVNRSVKVLKSHINNYQQVFNIGRGKHCFIKFLLPWVLWVAPGLPNDIQRASDFLWLLSDRQSLAGLLEAWAQGISLNLTTFCY